jgi:hypothetical protein
MKFSKKISPFLIILATVLFFTCAKQVAITGGPKDTTPPVLVKLTPENGSINFADKKIIIEFDEYVKLNSLNQKLIVSPPIDEAPVIVLKGKGIKISLNPALLKPNTTYSFNFNDAIADNNENNSLNSFVYAFSTGAVIDSLSFSGIVLDAFTKVPVTDAWVVLYSNLADSAVETISPSYITKVDKNGEFLIPFVHENDYHIFAVKDNNYNFLFDIPDEGIAFIDSVFRPGVTKIEKADSLKNKFKNYPDDIELLLFKENKQAQYIKSYKRLKPDYLEIVFNSPQSADYECVVEQDKDAVVFAKQNPDTVKIWIKNENLINSEMLTLICNYTDPIYPDSLRSDSLIFRKSEILIRDSIAKVTVNATKEPHLPLNIFVSNPIADYDVNKIKLELKSNDAFIPVDFKLLKDSLSPMCLSFGSQILEKSEYRIIMEAGFVSDIYNNKNILDTIEISTTSTSEYGNLRITLSGEQRSFIIQLIVGDKVIAETHGENGVAQFEYIKPGKYIVRAIEDLNNNKKWDTGDYAAKKLAEPVFYMSGEYEVRSNWNHDIEWNPVTNVSK